MINRTRDALYNARNLVANGWIQGHFATDGNENVVNPLDLQARCFCMLGACISAAYGRKRGVNAMRKHLNNAIMDILEIEYLAEHTRAGDALVWFNDAYGRKQEEVVAVFDRALGKEGA